MVRRGPWIVLLTLGTACFQGAPEASSSDALSADALSSDAPPTALSSCGDGEIRPLVEECDPPGPGCTTSCLTCDAPAVMAADGHCWEALGDGPYPTARDTCAGRRGGHIASPNSADEVEGPLAGFLESGAWYFLGLRDELVDGDWSYTTGEAPLAIPWATDEPDGGVDESCVVATPDGWRDVGCTAIAKAVCEREPPSLRPETGSAYRRDHARRDWYAARDGCPYGGDPSVITDADELEFLRATLPPGADCAWVGGTVGLDRVPEWIGPGGAASLPWAAGEPSQIGCLCVSAAGLAVRTCSNPREALCEIEP